jgi:hypothetical protein
MLQELFGSGALNIVYAVVVLVSFVFVVISLMGADFGDGADLDLDADIDGLDFISLSPFVLAMFGAAFGITGILTRVWLDMEPIPSILWSTGIGITIGGAAQVLFLYVLSPSKSSHYSLIEDAVGREVEVIVTIPAQGLGTIAYDNVSGRVTLGARSSTGKEIKRGEIVAIERITGRVALVHPTKAQA